MLTQSLATLELVIETKMASARPAGRDQGQVLVPYSYLIVPLGK